MGEGIPHIQERESSGEIFHLFIGFRSTCKSILPTGAIPILNNPPSALIGMSHAEH